MTFTQITNKPTVQFEWQELDFKLLRKKLIT